ncbi:hypothetical protein WR25_26761 [Diploscapter pachys]|uniref:LRRCT domain-containing protein n=1 Tax=Diploscapter pachys TaxID=2018661 RepID=A0A2A2LJ24_9BILA|nr:hypothetical protein WR25_26761 [Diploscapter pachys]
MVLIGFKKAFLKQSSHLEELVLAANALTAVPKLGRMQRLIHLNLDDNQISTVAEGDFNGLERLYQVRLQGNKICSLNGSAFKEIKDHLQLLDLSGNCFKSVPAQNLRNANRLAYLDLSDNGISEINNFELMNLPSLKELRLNNNLLSKINAMAFLNVPQLEYLYLRDNLISSLDGNRLQAFRQLELLDVSNNMLQTLPELKDLTSLKQVRLDGNLIERINTLAFSNNTQLQLISLQNNNIHLISRNSFDSLDKLQVLLLANNSIPTLERGMLDGMPDLQQLSLRNNSLRSITNTALFSLTGLTTLDLAYNRIEVIKKGAFVNQTKLFWLDLSNNQLKSFEQDTFNHKIANILLDGNPLHCDGKFDWMLNYLVMNRIRTFLPTQKEVKCASPQKFAGTSLKELMMKKANDTLQKGIKFVGLGGSSGEQMPNSLFSSFLPALGPLGSFGASQTSINSAGIPILSTITKAIPSLRTLPGIEQVANGLDGQTRATSGAQNVGSGINPEFNQALEEFTGPLVRFATGGQPVQADIEQFVKAIPNFVVNVPGFGDVDLRQLPPGFLQEIMRTGEIPGMPKELSDKIVKQAMQKMYDAAEAHRRGNPLQDHDKYLPPLDTIPEDILTRVINGSQLPGLNETQTTAIVEYYTQQLPTASAIPPGLLNSLSKSMSKDGVPAKADNNTLGHLVQMWKMLPAGYDLSKIPQEIIAALTSGKVPDLSKLPADLLEHFKSNGDKMASLFSQVKTNNVSIEDVLAKLPTFERPELSTFSPYDINKLTNDMVQEEEVQKKNKQMRIYTAIALGLVGAVTIVVLIVFALYFKKHKQLKTSSRGSLITGASGGSNGSSSGIGTGSGNHSGQISDQPSLIDPAHSRQIINQANSGIEHNNTNRPNTMQNSALYNGTRPPLPSECLFTEPPGPPLFNSTMKGDQLRAGGPPLSAGFSNHPSGFFANGAGPSTSRSHHHSSS